MTKIKSQPVQSPKTTKAAEVQAPKAPARVEKAAPVHQASGASKLEAAKVAQPTASGASAGPAAMKGVPADPKDMAVVCPVLGSLIAEGKVPMTPDGQVKIADLRKAFGDDIGFASDHQMKASNVGNFANKLNDVLKNTVSGSFNVLDMRAGLIKHQGDSAILTNGQFDQARFDMFVSHATKGVMTEDSFAEAIAANYMRDLDHGPRITQKFSADRAKDTAAGEYGALLAVFGTPDPRTGKMGITVQDLLAMFKDKDLPVAMRGTANKDVTAMKKIVETKADAYLANKAFRSTATATGLANAGARLVDGKPEGATGASAQAAVSAGKAANCPHLNGAAKMPTQVPEILTQHGAAS